MSTFLSGLRLVIVVVALGGCAASGGAIEENVGHFPINGSSNANIQMLDLREPGLVPRPTIPRLPHDFPWPWPGGPKVPPAAPDLVLTAAQEAAVDVLNELAKGGDPEKLVKAAACAALNAAPEQQAREQAWKDRIYVYPGSTGNPWLVQAAIDRAVDKVVPSLAGIGFGHGMVYHRVCGIH